MHLTHTYMHPNMNAKKAFSLTGHLATRRLLRAGTFVPMYAQPRWTSTKVKDYPQHTAQPSTQSTIDKTELAHFRTLSSKWWSGPELAPLRAMNQLRVPFIAEDFNDGNLTGVNVLDIGCGGGVLSEALARLGASVTGIDPVRENVEAASIHAEAAFSGDQLKLHCPNYQCCSIEEFSSNATNQATFDVVVASEVLEHVDNIDLFLRSALSCLRVGGQLVVTTINQTPFAYLGVIVAGENLFKLVPPGTHQYAKLVSPEALRLVLQQDYHCEVRQVHGMFFNPLTTRWSWTQSQWIHYAMRAVKMQ